MLVLDLDNIFVVFILRHFYFTTPQNISIFIDKPILLLFNFYLTKQLLIWFGAYLVTINHLESKKEGKYVSLFQKLFNKYVFN